MSFSKWHRLIDEFALPFAQNQRDACDGSKSAKQKVFSLFQIRKMNASLVINRPHFEFGATANANFKAIFIPF